MEEENQVQQETKNQQQETKNQVQRVTTKDPKKVEAGKRLAKYNRKKREEQKSKVLTSSQYYSVGAVIAVGVIGGLGYYLYKAKKGEVKDVSVSCNPTVSQQPRPHNNKFEMEKIYSVL